jgi:hypothetical protein
LPFLKKKPGDFIEFYVNFYHKFDIQPADFGHFARKMGDFCGFLSEFGFFFSQMV